MIQRRQFMKLLAGSAATGLAIGRAGAQSASTFPTRQVRIVTPYPPGSGLDVIARGLGEGLSGIWGQPPLVDNKVGASGMLGTAAAAKSVPDGYTLLLVASGTIAIAPYVFPNLGFDPKRDLTALMNIGYTPQVMVVGVNSKYKTFQNVMDATKAAPGKLRFASAGNGSTSQMTMELLKLRTGANLTHVPFKSGPEAYPSLMQGLIDVQFDSSIAVLSYVQSGQLKALAVSSRERVPFLPDVPTVIECGVPDFEGVGWTGVMGPAGMDPVLVKKINADLNKALAKPAAQKVLEGTIIVGGNPDDFAKYVDSEITKWSDVVKHVTI
jgi:tripartite-type tricarboxylate transporter receptor subunit TctC